MLRLCSKLVFSAIFFAAQIHGGDKMESSAQKSVYDFTVKGIDGKEVLLKEYKGKVLVMVNTASRCGFTRQYTDLEMIYEKYKEQGLVVLGFPSNDFGGQEPGTNAEIKTFCETKFKVAFPLFEKGPVTGTDIQPLYKYLTQEANPDYSGKVRWNFEKFIIDRNGRVIERFRSITSPSSDKLTSVLEKALQPPQPESTKSR